MCPVYRWARSLSVAAPFSLCIAVAALLAFHELGRRPLEDAEARYAIVAYEMLRSGDWIQPRLNTFPYYEKPPLLYWAIALAYHTFGVGEFAARFPSALAHVGTTALVFALTRSLLGSSAAVFGGLIYATELGGVMFARLSLTDGMLVFWLTLSLLGLTLTVQRKGGWALFYVGAAGAGLTKGLVGLVFPFATAAVYLLLKRDAEMIGWLRLRWGALVLIGLFLPWHVVLSIRDPVFLDFYVLNEHVYRFLNVREPIDYVPISVLGFWVSTAIWLLPWSLFLPTALVWARRAAAPVTLPVLWATIVISFFSLARSRLEKYGLPALPAVSVVIAGYWRVLVERPRRYVAITCSAVLVTLAGLGLLAAVRLFALRSGPPIELLKTLDTYYREHPEEGSRFLTAVVPLALPFSVVLTLLGLSTLAAALARRTYLSYVLSIVLLVPSFIIVNRATLILAPYRSQRDAAAIITREWQDDAHVVVDGLYDDAMSITFYTRRPTYLFGPNSGDLAFGFRRTSGSPLLLTAERFDTWWWSAAPVFLLTDRRPFPSGSRVLLDRPRFSLVTNRPPTPRTARE